MNNDKSEMTVTDIINIYLTRIGIVKTKRLMLHKDLDDKQRNNLESAIDKIFNEGINPK